MADRKATILAAMLRVKEDDFTSSGKPSVDGLNEILEADGDDPTNSKERDEHWQVFFEMSEESIVEEEAIDVEDPGFTTITVTEAASNPVRLFVHGTGTFTLPHNEAVRLPTEALNALNDSDVRYTIGDSA